MDILRQAAQQALEALDGVLDTYGEPLDLMTISGGTYEALECRDAITALRAALAQPELEPYKGDVTRIMRDAGMTFHLGLPHKAVIEQMTRVVDLVCAEASIKAAQKFAVALAQPEQLVVGGDDLPTLTKWTPQRKPLTEEEIELAYREIWRDLSDGCSHTSVKWIEAGIRYAEKVHGIANEP